MPENYPSSQEIIRNVSRIALPFEVLVEEGRFRIVRFESPGWDGYPIWILNEKGFLWEPASDLEAAQAYLESSEAKDYQAGKESEL